MKVVLTQNVKDLGKKGALLDVSAGYARNCLFPQKLASPATSAVMKEAQKAQETLEKNKQKMIAEFDMIEKKLKGAVLEFTEKAQEDGTLYGSVKKDAIVSKIEEVLGSDFYSDFIVGESTFRKTGEHEVDLRLGEKEIAVTIKIAAE